MDFAQRAFKEYVKDLYLHLFEEMPFEKLIRGISHNHQVRRFVQLYLIQDKEIFDSFYLKRYELGLNKLFSQIILGVLHQPEKLLIKQKIINWLEIEQTMASETVSQYELREVTKDLNAFVAYATKKVLVAPVG